MNAEHDDRVRDVAIVGGGSAGSSAALTLARADQAVAGARDGAVEGS